MGQLVNKLVLRDSMAGKLSYSIVNKTYSAALSAIIQMNFNKLSKTGNVIKMLDPLIEFGIINPEKAIIIINNRKLVLANAQSLHSCLLFSNCVNTLYSY